MLQPDGKILVAGNTFGLSDFSLSRYLPDGTLDTTFNFDGRVQTDIADSGDSAASLALQPDGRIVVAGTSLTPTLPGFSLVRYQNDLPAFVESVAVNDGAAQRSMGTSLTVTFDRVVTLLPGAFEVTDGEGQRSSP